MSYGYPISFIQYPSTHTHSEMRINEEKMHSLQISNKNHPKQRDTKKKEEETNEQRILIPFDVIVFGALRKQSSLEYYFTRRTLCYFFR